jgi:hypothetical protein
MLLEEVLFSEDRNDYNLISELKDMLYEECNNTINGSQVNYNVTIVDTFGGEGKGEKYWVIFSISINGDPDTEKTYRVNGEYYSYAGVTLYFSNIEEVKKVKVTTTKWKAVKN